MTIPTATRLTDGAVMQWADVHGAINTYRGWVNDIPVGDISAAAVQTEHIVRPRVVGYPMNSFRAQRQVVQTASFGLNASAVHTPEQWASRPDRLTIYPFLLGSGGVWNTPLGFRLVLPVAATVEICMTWEWQIRHREGSVSAPTYPNSTDGVDSDAGYFSLFSQRRYGIDGNPVSGAATERSVTRNYVTPFAGDALDYVEAGTYRYHDRGAIRWTNTSTNAGVWDFWLGYTAETSGIANDLFQLDVSAFSATLDALL